MRADATDPDDNLTKSKTIELCGIVQRFGGELVGDGKTEIRQVATLESAGPGAISFLVQARYLPQLKATQAAAVIVGLDFRGETELPRIVSTNPYAYFAKVSELLNPPAPVRRGKHRSAVVERTAQVAKSASIGACSVIGRGARIGDNVVIGPGCNIGAGVKIGDYTRLHPNVTVCHDCVVGERCIIHPGAVIGADGFGLAPDAGAWRKIPQIGRVIIGDDVEIGANTTIDRGAIDDTVIEDGVKLDNLIQIAHNVRIGAHTAIAACVGIAGSARIGRNCAIGGSSNILGHISIADNVRISACTFVTKSLREAGTYSGVYPFSNHKEWLRNAVHLRDLDGLVRRIRDIEATLKDAEKDQS